MIWWNILISATAKDLDSFCFTDKEQLKSNSIDEPTVKKRAISFNLAGAGLGIKYFPTSIKLDKFMFHTGATVATIFSDAIYPTGSGDVPVIISAPLGISYSAVKRLNFGVDIGPGVRFENGPAFTPYGNIKIGLRF